MKIKRFLSWLLVLSFVAATLAFVGCDKTPQDATNKLDAPQSISVSSSGLISWSASDNATGYKLSLNGQITEVTETSYQLPSLVNDVLIFVVATADGYEDSDASQTVRFRGRGTTPVVSSEMAIDGPSSVRSGRKISLSATIDDVAADVDWSISKGGEYASVDADGVVTAATVDGDKIVTVKAVSRTDDKVFAEKVINVLGAPALTQAMLDEYADSAMLAFDGFVSINMYNYGLSHNLAGTQTLLVKTRMDGSNWYASYENAGAGLESELFYKNVDGYANQAVLNYRNTADFYPLLDEDGNNTTWENAGLRNNFVGLTTNDFEFDQESWRWQYVGGDEKFTEKMVASANPFNFVVSEENPVSLLIDDGHIVGLYVKSGSDFSITSAYECVLELFVAVSNGDSVEVPTITTFKYDERQAPLKEALENMRNLKSYKLDFRQITATQYTSTPTQSGFEEIINGDDCYFRNYTFGYDEDNKQIKKYETVNVDGSDEPQDSYYGFHKISDQLYNSYTAVGNKATPARAFKANISQAKPSFDFAAELFTTFTEEQDDGSIVYYVNSAMYSVASKFYYGMGNDIALYGMYASSGLVDGMTFSPYVVVKDGYIVESAFYFFLGTIYGYVYIDYSDFNQTDAVTEATTLPSVAQSALSQMTPRQVPVSWNQLTVIVGGDDSSTTTDDEEVNAETYFKEFLGEEGYNNLPFFGDCLGDTYAFSLESFMSRGGSTVYRKCQQMYYDVPLDSDYSINSSLNAIYKLLTDNGFVRNKYGEYQKGNVIVKPVDSSLDLFIYVWAAD